VRYIIIINLYNTLAMGPKGKGGKKGPPNPLKDTSSSKGKSSKVSPTQKKIQKSSPKGKGRRKSSGSSQSSPPLPYDPLKERDKSNKKEKEDKLTIRKTTGGEHHCTICKKTAAKRCFEKRHVLNCAKHGTAFGNSSGQTCRECERELKQEDERDERQKRREEEKVRRGETTERDK
jgi:hypothetical protein